MAAAAACACLRCVAGGEGVTGGVGGRCVVCLEPLASGPVVRRLACGHALHAACLAEWWERAPAPTCPTCRARDADAERWRAWAELAFERPVGLGY